MTNQIKTASESLKEIILSALGNLIADGKLPAEPMPPFKVHTLTGLKSQDRDL